METTARPAIEMQPVESSQIAAIGHHAETNTLAIQFIGKTGPGSTYHYQNFTVEMFDQFKGAESVGSHFYKHIKPFSDKHPYERIADDEITRLQGVGGQHLSDNRTNSYPMADASTPPLASLAAVAGDDEAWPTAAEIVDAVVESLGIDRKHAIIAAMRCDFTAELERAA